MSCEMSGGNLKLKYRVPKRKGMNRASPSGNSGTPKRHGEIPRGMRRKIKPGAKQYR